MKTFAEVSTESNVNTDSFIPDFSSGSAYYLTKFDIWPKWTIFDIYIFSKKDLSNNVKSLLIFCTWHLLISLYQRPAEKLSKDKVWPGVLKFTAEFYIF